MSYTYEQLEQMTVAELRKIAEGIDHEAVHGYSTMHKEKLLPAICLALGIDAHKHHKTKAQNKTTLKQQIKLLKRQRDDAIANKDKTKLEAIRQQLHDLKGKLRRSVL